MLVTESRARSLDFVASCLPADMLPTRFFDLMASCASGDMLPTRCLDLMDSCLSGVMLPTRFLDFVDSCLSGVMFNLLLRFRNFAASLTSWFLELSLHNACRSCSWVSSQIELRGALRKRLFITREESELLLLSFEEWRCIGRLKGQTAVTRPPSAAVTRRHLAAETATIE